MPRAHKTIRDVSKKVLKHILRTLSPSQYMDEKYTAYHAQ